MTSSSTNFALAKELFGEPLSSLKFYVNGELKDLINIEIDPKKTVLEYLRENGLTGTKYGCGEGGCGACTVVIAEHEEKKNMIKYRSANACLLPLCSVHGKQIITIEGIGNPEMPHCIQVFLLFIMMASFYGCSYFKDRLAKGHGSQCGFCTPGIVMAFYGFLKLNPNPSIKDIEESLDGNLCRCTGYRPILESFRTFSNESHKDDNNNDLNEKQSCNSSKSKSCKLADFTELKPYDPNADLPFPTELIILKPSSLVIAYDNLLWLQPISVQQLLKSKKKFPTAVLIGGNTEIGIDTKIKLVDYPVFINISKISDLQELNVISNGDRDILEIGANITLNELIEKLKQLKKECKPHQVSLLNALLSNLKWFASNQIRNFATLAGNIVTASPISDLNPILMTAEATLTIASETEQRELEMCKFFLGYRKVDLKGDEVLLKVKIPFPKSNLEIIRAYKQAKRRDDDIAIVNAAFKVEFENEQNYIISKLNLAYGGLAPTSIFLTDVQEKSKGLKWGENESLQIIQDAILKKINLPYTVPGGMPTYRRTLSVSLFTKFWHHIIKDLNILTNYNEKNGNIDVDEIEREISSSIHEFGESATGEPYIGTTDPNVMSLKQTTGVAKYVDDIPKQANELYAGAVLSSKPHAIIKNVDPSKALALKGVHAYVDHKDIKHNRYGIITKDDEFFASNEVNFVGQLIGLIIADSKSLARKAASLVHIDYEPLKSVLTIEDAIENNSFYEFHKTITKGDFDSDTFKVDNDDELVFEGTCRIGGQEHFYLETHGCLAIPKNEDNEMEIYSSTQSPTEVQKEVAEALQIPSNRVVCRVKRLGGGFGGKETRATFVAVVAAAAAHKLKRPVRFILDRDIDMLITGTRHPFFAKYKLKITKDGLFKAYNIDLISNAGYSYDLSRAVMEGALLTVDNVYNFPKLRVSGRLAKTNIASNTA